MPDPAVSPVLRPGGGLRNPLVLPQLYRRRDQNRHQRPGLCQASARPLPQGVQGGLRPDPRTGGDREADLSHYGPREAGGHPGGLRLRPGSESGQPHQLCRAGGGPRPRGLSAGGFFGGGVGERPDQELPPGAGDLPLQREPGAGGPAARGRLRAQADHPEVQLCHLF